MSFFLPQPARIEIVQSELLAYTGSDITVRYRDTSGVNSATKTVTANQLIFDLTQGFDEQIIANSVRFKLGGETFIDRTASLYRNIDPDTGSGTMSGSIQYGTGRIAIDSWTPNTTNAIELQSLTTSTDFPPINHVSFRIPQVPVRPQSLTVVLATLEHGNLTLTADEQGNIETSRAHGYIDYITGFVDLYFYTKTQITVANREEIEAQPWYDVALEYAEAGDTYINVPVWVDPSTVKYNAVSYSYIPLDADIIGLSATRLPQDGRVPIFRVGEIAIVSATKDISIASPVAGTTYDLGHARIAWCELEDSTGMKVDFDLYTVNYDLGKVTLSGDFDLGLLIAPLKAKYRYQDMLLIRDVQINGQLTFTKALTHNYDADDTIVGSAVVIGDMFARYTNKFVQQAWNSTWSNTASGSAISANYNDTLYPIEVTNKGAAQERWAIVFTDTTTFRCIGEVSGQIGTGTTLDDFSPINPTTGEPYFVIRKEGWGSGWSSGNVLRFNTIAATHPIWAIRTVKPSEPTVISDSFQIMLRGDINRDV